MDGSGECQSVGYSLSAEVLREFLGPPGNRDIGNFPLAGTVDSATVRRTILEVRMPVAADAAASEGIDDPAEAPTPSGSDDSGKDPARSWGWPRFLSKCANHSASALSHYQCVE